MRTLCYTCRFDRRLLETMSNSKLSMILMVRITGMRDRWKKKYSRVGKTLGWILIRHQGCLSKLHLSSFKVWDQPSFMASFSIWPLLMFFLTIPSIESLSWRDILLLTQFMPVTSTCNSKESPGTPTLLPTALCLDFHVSIYHSYVTFWIPNM